MRPSSLSTIPLFLVGFAASRPFANKRVSTLLKLESLDTHIQRRQGLTEAQVAALAPPLGWTAGVNPKPASGTCDGAVDDENGVPIQVPCDCPPAQDLYIADLTANANAGFAVNNTVVAVGFPTDASIQSQLARLSAASITIQNLRGIGVGCPVSSTTFVAQQAALEAELPPTPSGGGDGSSGSVASSSAPTSTVSTTASSISTTAPPVTTSIASTSVAPPSSATSAPTSATSPSSTTSAPLPPPSGVPSDATISALTPSLGWSAGINPKGNGNCDGAVLDDTGEPIQVPCSCPPTQADFIQLMITNVDAGFAVNNTNIPMPFPVDDSAMSLVTRLDAAIATLQNMRGSGIGCPVQSTTLSMQLSSALEQL